MAAKSVFKEALPHARVLNQSKELVDYNLFLSDGPLRRAVAVLGGDWAKAHLTDVGAVTGTREIQTLSVQANRNPPVLKPYDRFGHRTDYIDFHPAYHEIMRLGIERCKLPTFAWINRRKGSHVARGASAYMMYQAEAGTQCPQTMTFAVIPVFMKHLTQTQAKFFDWNKAAHYDERDLPIGRKRGLTVGMSMTERQGGSDVRANTTVATPIDSAVRGAGAGYYLNGHKWFTSAGMSDVFLTLAQTEKGLSCFLVPRWVPHTEERNRGFNFTRMKDKLGDRSNAGCEVEYRDAYGEMIGPEGRGVATILEMVHHTRLDCTMGSAGLIRRIVMEAVHHARHRSAFGTRLSDAPLMQNVLAHMIVESEAATLLSMFLASLFDGEDAATAKLCRLTAAVAKYHICKRAPSLAYEAMECFGGNGFIEDSPMPYLYRQAPLNAIWEGSGNVICLDVVRSATVEPECLTLFVDEVIKGFPGSDPASAEALAGLKSSITGLSEKSQLRRHVTNMAQTLQLSLLNRFGRPEVAAAFRDGVWQKGLSHYGTLPASADLARILEPYHDLGNAAYETRYVQ
eukprot:m.242253 g.242253  ORF g.242253 m.242253 type:complete len:570 (-) comp13993_c0_seq1:64-1773(-)